ncbi:MAG: bile acid:sodium symporter [Prevotellaceae bacterium]|nr:bile acid:sodium symporter [Candidatus Faecinaster equi]
MLQFIKTWTLPLAMITGVIGYFILANISLFASAKPSINSLITFLTPTLIFLQLLLTFCKINPKELLPQTWHIWLILIQILFSGIISAIIISIPMLLSYKIMLEGMMICFICPTATAAAVVTAKLGGNASSLTTYTLLSNIMAAILVPLMFPLVESHAGLTFWATFMKILSKVLPLLLAPFVVAMILRQFSKKLYIFFGGHSGMAFYIWAIALTIVMGQSTRSIVLCTEPIGIIFLISLGGLIACTLQFFLGKKIGTIYNDRISAGQALGQKNTVLAIWMACTYLNPISSIAAGSYIVWQNIFNSWQIYKMKKNDRSTRSFR